MLHAAYNDAQGVTAAFNLNLLARANRELGTRFELEQFAHSAFYNAPLQRIEMHLVSRRAPDDRARRRAPASSTRARRLHTENSYKFTVDGLRALAVRAGFRPGPVWTDPRQAVQRALAARTGLGTAGDFHGPQAVGIDAASSAILGKLTPLDSGWLRPRWR